MMPVTVKNMLYLILLSLPACLLQAAIYKTIQPSGLIVFSDQPSKSSQEINISNLAQINSFALKVPAPVTPTALQNSSTEIAHTQTDPAFYTVTITSPANNTTLQLAEAPYLFTATSTPIISSPDKTTLILSIYNPIEPKQPDQVAGILQSDGTWTFKVNSLSVEELRLIATVINKQNNTVLATSDAVTVYFKYPPTKLTIAS